MPIAEMQHKARKLVDSSAFQKSIVALIILSAILVGIETNVNLYREHHSLFRLLDYIVLILFTVEIIVRFVACGSSVRRFFSDPWNTFDFSIVAVCYLPLGAQYFTVLRLARILRVYRLINKVPRLNILVRTLLDSLPSIGYLLILLFMHFYVYGTTGVFLFGRNDPENFGNLSAAFMSLFEIITLEGWIDLYEIQRLGCDAVYEGNSILCPDSDPKPVAAAVYFISFILIGAMIMLNLFIAVITNSLQEMHDKTEMELRAKKMEGKDIYHDIEVLKSSIDQLQAGIAMLEMKLKKKSENESRRE